MLESIDTVAGWLPLLSSTLDRHQAEINALNVFPIPDGDTGTNMALTVSAGVEAVQALPPDASQDVITATFAQATLAGARGNSGVILAEYLRAFLTALGTDASAGNLASALHAAADAAYACVGEPMEGTILSVARAAAVNAQTVVAGHSSVELADLVLSVIAAAAEALNNTPTQLPALARAGVVDAGGRGLVVTLESLGEFVTGTRLDEVPATLATPHIDDCSMTDVAFEVMYRLEAAADRIDEMRRLLMQKGDSVVIAGTEPLWSVHVHTDDVGAVIEAGLAVGRPLDIQVNDLRTVVAPAQRFVVTAMESGNATGVKRSARGLVAVAHGPGMREVLESAEVQVVMAKGRIAPSAAELRSAMESTGCAEIVVLPSSSAIRAAAELAADAVREAGVTVAVIPTRSIVQTLAAVAVHDPAMRFADDVVAMTSAATATHYGGVSISTRDAMTTAGRCGVGDVLGIIEGDVVEIGQSIDQVAYQLLTRMLAAGGELVTVIRGSDAQPDTAAEVLNRLRREHPGIEIVQYDGGQPLWPLIVGVE
jgi:hypothetical protein